MKTDKPLSKLEYWLYRHYRWVHGVRIAIAFLASFMLIRILNIPEGSWPLITLVVVIGPISTWGNVFPRAIQRIIGTVLGSISGLIALKLEMISLPLMLGWCGIVMFCCGYLTLGKRPYMALLIGITLGVVVGAPAGDFLTALWRGGDVVFGCLLSIFFTGIFTQRAYVFWRLRLADALVDSRKIYHTGLSSNLLEKPRLNKPLQQLLTSLIKMRSLLEPACKETRIPRSVFEGIQTIQRNMVNTMEMQINAWWSSRESHLLLLNAPTLRRTQATTEQMLDALADMLRNGVSESDQLALSSAAMDEITGELTQLLAQAEHAKAELTPVYGYVWLSLELTKQLERMRELIRLALRR